MHRRLLTGLEGAKIVIRRQAIRLDNSQYVREAIDVVISKTEDMDLWAEHILKRRPKQAQGEEVNDLKLNYSLYYKFSPTLIIEARRN